MADRTLHSGAFARAGRIRRRSLWRTRAAVGVVLACAAALSLPCADLSPVGSVALSERAGALPRAWGLERLGSIVLKAHHEVHGKKEPLAGDTYSLALVARGSVEGATAKFSTVKAFEEYDCDWGSLDAASLRAKAKRLDAFAQKGGLFTAGDVITNHDGVASFGALSCGVYLLSRTACAPENEGVLIDPVLVLVPYEVDGALFFDVEVTPKSEDPSRPIDPEDPDKPIDPDNPDKPVDPGDPDGPDEPDGPDDPDGPGGSGDSEKPDNPLDEWLEENGLPQTGDIQFQVAAALLILGIAMLAASRLMRRQKRDDPVDVEGPSDADISKEGSSGEDDGDEGGAQADSQADAQAG